MSIKKSFIALAVAGVFAAPVAAMAADGMMHAPSNVTIYGQMNASIDSIMDDNGRPGVASTFKTTKNNLSSTETRIGFKGSEDMGDGFTALWQIESQVNLDNDNNGLNNAHNATTGGTRIGERNTFVGVTSTEMGTVVAGRHDTPYKMSTRMLDPFRFTIADNRSIMGNTIHDDFIGNVVAYVSPTMNGLSFSAGTAFGSEMRDTAPAATTNKKSSTLSLAGKYTMDGIYGIVAYQSIKFGTAAGTFNQNAFQLITGLLLDKATAMKIGGSYSMDLAMGMPVKASAVYEQLETDLVGGTTIKNSNLYIAGELGVTKEVKVKGAYTMGSDLDINGVTTNSGRNQATLGADYGLSARTTVYANYTKLKNDAAINVNFLAKLGPQSTGTSTGMAPSALSVGVRHMF